YFTILMYCSAYPLAPRALTSFPTRRSSDLRAHGGHHDLGAHRRRDAADAHRAPAAAPAGRIPVLLRHRPGHALRAEREHQRPGRSEEHTSELQSRFDLVCRLLLEKKYKNQD